MKAVLAAVVVAAALVGVHLAAGGADFAPSATADPCAARGAPRASDGAQRLALAVLDGAGCELGVPREELLLALLDRRAPEGVSEAQLTNALAAGVERARREGALGAQEAGALGLALRLGGAQALLDLVLRR
jgi:hypothetical protein